jgi:hypothetical protein
MLTRALVANSSGTRPQGIKAAKGFLDVPIELVRLGCRDKPAVHTREQSKADAALQFRNRPAHRRLGDTEMLSRFFRVIAQLVQDFE